MTFKLTDRPYSSAHVRWWFEWEFFLSLVIVAGAYFARSGALTVRGEEPRWSQVAFEMKHFGDWIAPREQGELFMSRPPLHVWMLAGCNELFGSRDGWVLRLPSVIAILLTSTLLYGYARLTLSPTLAMLTALIFPTMGEMFQTGLRAESEAVFILFISSSLLLWHWGYVRKWRPILTWTTAYCCLALASLSKGGMQPPVYFFGTVGSFLLLTGNLRFFFRFAHLGGLLVGAAIIACWFVPYYLQHGWANAYGVWMGDTASRFRSWEVANVARHMAQFPIEVLGSIMPWSILIFAYCRPTFLRWLRANHPEALFCCIAVAVAFPSCWIPPGGQTRYFAPLYPCVAVLIGFVIHSSFAESAPATLKGGWRAFLVFIFVLETIAVFGISACSIFLRAGDKSYLASPWPLALAYFVVFALLAWITLKNRNGFDEKRVRSATLAIIGFMIVFSVGFLTDLRVRRSEDTAKAMARLKEALPPHQHLVSFGHIDALFAFHYDHFIDTQPEPTGETDIPPGTWFCFDSAGNTRPILPFPWQEIAAVSMDRNVGPAPERVVVVGQRLPALIESDRTEVVAAGAALRMVKVVGGRGPRQEKR